MMEQFAIDVDKGLSAKQKSLPSKYFYDVNGDELFVKIMRMPEYYLANAELEIFQQQTEKLIHSFGMNGEHFEIVELGAGDGTKVLKMLQTLNGSNFTYAPIDISSNALNILSKRLLKEVPGLDFDGKQGEYFEVLEQLGEVGKKVILFLGSNIGNLTDEQAHDFMLKIAQGMNPQDKLLIGFDLKKDAKIIERAYDDPHGYTSAFNLNLLARINRELDGNFELENFEHTPVYDAENGVALSYLKSKKTQIASIKAIGKTFHFEKDELIHTEISRKYDLETINKIAENTGLSITQVFYDRHKYFVDVLFEKGN